MELQTGTAEDPKLIKAVEVIQKALSKAKVVLRRPRTRRRETVIAAFQKELPDVTVTPHAQDDASSTSATMNGRAPLTTGIFQLGICRRSIAPADDLRLAAHLRPQRPAARFAQKLCQEERARVALVDGTHILAHQSATRREERRHRRWARRVESATPSSWRGQMATAG